MDVEDLSSALEIWKVYLNYSVESARPDEGRVQQVLPVCSGHNNHVAVCAKTIHLH